VSEGAGYSGTPLWKKLGITPISRIAARGAPDGFIDALGKLPEGARFTRNADGADLFVLFATDSSEMVRLFDQAIRHLPATGAVWTAWPKRSSGVATDLTENVLRDLFLPRGLVDNKVCAIDEVWSGLRFVVRRENRDTWAGSGPVA
jgi:hypothetical protein